ncbi:hypothetical protein BJK06_17485 [Curtobacterium sp. BH-2-1-1]|uniref:hypothetical protein n=1 Tax=Curtobacterium sp. BH-2-1-1 TaxID=1905847 RepID=UPI00089DDAE4|nr:hypothetical protein [Curtobacterium sp. BH-2-1-1]AOX67269.1 hypothetical protein BJK06_17485 [Curtobacterium sp. BH-2-1-1]
MADDDVTAERARLEALAWGGAASETDAAAARLALERLGRGRRGPGGAAPASPRARSTGRSRPTPAAGSDRAVTSGTTSPFRTGGARPLAGSSGAAADQMATPAPGPVSMPSTPGPRTPDAGPPGAAAAAGAPGPFDPAATDDTSGVPDGPDHGVGTGHGTEPGDRDGGGSRLLDRIGAWRTRAARVFWTTRPRVWIGLGVAAAVGVAFAAGTVVGTSRPDPAAAPSVTPSAGTITLEDLLDAPQTYADQLPGPVEAPVTLRTTRLIFTNRALDGGSFETPWSVWAGVGTDRSTICLVATANRLESTSACYPRQDALHGSVSLSAQSMSGTLTLSLRGGGVQGTVTNEN